MAEFDFVTDLGLIWLTGKMARIKRDVTDHIQIHHSVSDYSTPAKWASLHKHWQVSGERGMRYSYGICPDGTIYLGRGLEYKHGAVKNTLTKNGQGVGAADRSVSIVLIGDMRKPGMPTDKQLASAIKLVTAVMAKYSLSPSAVLGHRELHLWVGGKETSKTYPTQCPCLDMNAFRTKLSNVNSPATPVETTKLYVYSGSSYVNIRTGPGTSYEAIDKLKAGERCEVTQRSGMWAKIQKGNTVGWCISDYLKEI